MKFKTQYTENVSKGIEFVEPSMTDESFKDECDLGFIVSNYVNKGIPLPEQTMSYVDCTTVKQFEEAQQIVAEAKSSFYMLPSADRDRFENKVENYLEFISNPENLRESYERNYIDPSSIDLCDVYPEKYQYTSDVIEKPVEKATNDVSENTSSESST